MIGPKSNNRYRYPLNARALLVLAIVSSVLIIAAGQGMMWGLYTQSADSAASRDAAGAAVAPDALVFAVGRTPGGPGEWVAFARVLSALQHQLQRPLHIRYAPTRGEVVDLLHEGEADFAFVSTYRYLELHALGRASLVVSPVIDGHALDAAVLVVVQESDVRKLDELEGATLLVADPRSLGGNAFAYWVLAERGVKPDEFFSNILSASSQDRSLSLLSKGRADVACVNRSALATWPEDTFRIIAESPEYGMPPLVGGNAVDQSLILQVQEALTSLDVSSIVGPDSALEGFRVPDDAEYDFARTLAEIAGPQVAAEASQDGVEP